MHWFQGVKLFGNKLSGLPFFVMVFSFIESNQIKYYSFENL